MVQMMSLLIKLPLLWISYMRKHLEKQSKQTYSNTSLITEGKILNFNITIEYLLFTLKNLHQWLMNNLILITPYIYAIMIFNPLPQTVTLLLPLDHWSYGNNLINWFIRFFSNDSKLLMQYNYWLQIKYHIKG